MKKKSLKIKLSIILAIVVIVPMALISSAVLAVVGNELQESILHMQEISVQNEAQGVEHSIQDYSKTIFLLRDLPPIQGIIRAEEGEGVDAMDNSSIAQWKNRLEHLFIQFAESDPSIFQLRYIDKNGQEIVRVDSKDTAEIIPTDALQNKKNRYYFTEAMTTPYNNVFVSTFDLNIENNEIELPHRLMYRVATPVANEHNGDIEGIVIVNIDASSLFGNFFSASNKHSERIIFDQNGYFLLHPEQSKLYGRDLGNEENYFLEQPELQKNVFLTNTKRHYDKEEGEYRIWAKNNYQIDNEDKFIVFLSRISEESILSSLENLRRNIYISILLAGLICIAIVFFLVREILAPVEYLQSVAEKITGGDLDVHFEGKEKNDEIGRLAKSFDEMTKKLRSLHVSLETKVKEKTKDLAKKVKEAEKQKSAILNIMDDLAESKQKTEEAAQDAKKFQQAVEASTNPVAIADSNLVFTYVNASWEKQTGYSSKEIIGNTPELLLIEEGKDLQYKKIQHAAKNGVKFYTEDFIYVRKNKSEYNAAVTMYPILNQNNTPDLFVLLLEDITRRKRIDAAKSEFVSLASHQLRTPLTAIRWIFNMFDSGKAGDLSDQQKELMSDAQKCTIHMNETIGTMLTMSRIESGKVHIEWAELALNTLIEDIIGEYKITCESKKQHCLYNSPDNITLTTDSKLLKEVLTNLISNAMKYSPEGSDITVSSTQESGKIVIAITDSGYGIPEHQKDKIFTKFFRAENVIGKQTEGTGLGLYVVHSIVKILEGKIEFSSEENKGTTFTITLPILPEKHV